MLVNGQGTRIDKAPSAIVSDLKRPDRLVETGISCMSCHARGMNFKDDEVRSLVLTNADAYPGAYAEKVLALYPPVDKFRELQKKDAGRFAVAVEKRAARQVTPTPSTRSPRSTNPPFLLGVRPRSSVCPSTISWTSSARVPR